MDANLRLIPEWNTALNPAASSNWLWLFNAWDSPHFQLIAQLGYSHPDYVYLPGYPILIHLAGLLTGNYWFGGFLVTQIFALASIVMFQLVAEQYMQPKKALYATLVMSTFPYFSVFTILSYSEAVFLFSTLSAWYFYKKGVFFASSLLAGLASVTRIYGIMIVLPMVLNMINSKRYRRLLYLVVPAMLLGAWVAYCYLSTGDPLATWTDEKWFTSNIALKFSLGQYVLSQARGVISTVLDPAVLVSVCLFGLLVLKTWQVDRYLWVYSISLFAPLIFLATNELALLRFFTFIFPVWLTVKARNVIIVGTCIALFVPVTLLLWLYAINVTFIG